MILRNIKVINCSYGIIGGYGCYASAWQTELYDDDVTKEFSELADQCAETLAQFFERLIKKGYDFVIVQASGNASNYNVIRLKYEDGDYVTDENGNVTFDEDGVPWAVVEDRDGLYVNLQDNVRRNINDLDVSQIKSGSYIGCTYTSLVTAIDPEEHPDVYNRIIVVGGYGFHDTIIEAETEQVYFTVDSIYSNSNLGDRVDILAPAENIFSATYSADEDKNQGVQTGDKYQYMGGTSMAAPHVAGVAAMVWSANHSLSGDEVKRIICENSDYLYCSDGKVSSLRYRCLNAEKAVRAALGYTVEDGKEILVVVLDEDEPEAEPQNGGILGYVVDSVNQKPTPEASVTAVDEEGTEYVVATDSEGHFELVLPEGSYTLKAMLDGYEETVLSETFEVAAGEVITLKYNVELVNLVDAIINAYIDNEECWLHHDGVNSEMWFQDLDFDGVCELICNSYTYDDAFRVVENNIEVIQNEYKLENLSELSDLVLYYNTQSDTYIYLRYGGWINSSEINEIYYQNEKIIITRIFETNDENFDNVNDYFWSKSEGELSKAEYEKSYNSYFKNLQETSYVTDVININDYISLSRQEKFNILKQSYESFKIGEPVAKWKSAYIEFANSYLYEHGEYEYRLQNVKYTLVDIDENGIPEMFIYSGSGAGGSTFITYNENGIERLDYGNSSWISYIKGGNIFNYSGGHMDNYYDNIYKIQNGSYVLVASGDFGAIDNSNVNYDEYGYPVYTYYWNDIEVSESEYQNSLNRIFDTSKEIEPETYYFYSDIVEVISNY